MQAQRGYIRSLQTLICYMFIFGLTLPLLLFLLLDDATS